MLKFSLLRQPGRQHRGDCRYRAACGTSVQRDGKALFWDGSNSSLKESVLSSALAMAGLGGPARRLTQSSLARVQNYISAGSAAGVSVCGRPDGGAAGPRRSSTAHAPGATHPADPAPAPSYRSRSLAPIDIASMRGRRTMRTALQRLRRRARLEVLGIPEDRTVMSRFRSTACGCARPIFTTGPCRRWLISSSRPERRPARVLARIRRVRSRERRDSCRRDRRPAGSGPLHDVVEARQRQRRPRVRDGASRRKQTRPSRIPEDPVRTANMTTTNLAARGRDRRSGRGAHQRRLHRVSEGRSAPGGTRRVQSSGSIRGAPRAACARSSPSSTPLRRSTVWGFSPTPRTYDAWIRFANASSQSDREKDVRGMAVRISGVAGENLTPGESRQDFVLNSHPVMVAANTKDFLELLKAMDAGGLRQVELLPVAPALGGYRIPGTTAANQPPGHPVLEHDAVPVRSGPRREVHRASVRAARRRRSLRAVTGYLSDRRACGSACGRAMPVSISGSSCRPTPETMPIEDATVEWKESDSPWHMVARIRIPQQDVGDAETRRGCVRRPPSIPGTASSSTGRSAA